jgi:RNA polymerase sigma-70 factor (ECF subfamily)
MPASSVTFEIVPDRHANLAEGEPALDPADAARLRSMIETFFDFIWRSLRRLGVAEADADDATQQVFLVASRKLARVTPGAERSFLFGIALRVASDARRTRRRRREVDEAALPEQIDEGPSPDERVDSLRARALLDQILDEMPLDLGAVFVLFEIEELGSREIASMLGLPVGTVASRLRRAREEFRHRLERHKAQRGRK